MVKHFASGAEDLVRRRIKRIALTAALQNAISFAWQNPEDKPIVVTRLVLDVTTASTGAATMDCGIVNGPTDTADTLIDGVALNATGAKDNIADVGSNGKSRGKMSAKDGSTDYITGKVLSASGAGLVGYAYIEYLIVED